MPASRRLYNPDNALTLTAALLASTLSFGGPARAQSDAVPLPSTGQAQKTADVSVTLKPRVAEDREIYDAVQFERFNPRTALEMVEQIPGFSIAEGDDSQRGLGQADDNILINGARISGKSNDAASALGRINASAVIRIEIVDGTSLDIPGLSGQVLNLVTKNVGFSGNFLWEPVFRQRLQDDLLSAELSISGKLAGGNYTLALENDRGRFGNFGPEVITSVNPALSAAENAAASFLREELGFFSFDRPSLTLHYDRTASGGNKFNLDLRIAGELRDFGVDTVRTLSGPSNGTESFRDVEDGWSFEGTIDYEFSALDGRLKLIAFQRYANSPNSFTSISMFDNGDSATGSRFTQDSEEGETVIRAEQSWKSTAGSDWQLAVEGAFNFLDRIGDLALLDDAGIFQPSVLNNATSRVEELRGEAIVTHGRSLAKSLSTQISLGVEYSEISQTGAGGLSRSFVRPKGSVSLIWRPSKNFDITGRVERSVGQLDFGDFIASVDLENSTSGSAGNPSLVPPQSWETELDANIKFGSLGSANVRVFHNWISDIVDSIPISATAEARGNLDSARQYGIELTSTFLLGSLGWKGAKLDINGFLQSSRLTDPLLGNRRGISSERRRTIGVVFRHDIPASDWAWGGQLDYNRDRINFRLDQQSFNFDSAPDLRAFLEHKDVFGLTARLTVRNLLNQRNSLDNSFFVGRRDGPIDFIESRRREFGRPVIFRLTGNF